MGQLCDGVNGHAGALHQPRVSITRPDERSSRFGSGKAASRSDSSSSSITCPGSAASLARVSIVSCLPPRSSPPTGPAAARRSPIRFASSSAAFWLLLTVRERLRNGVRASIDPPRSGIGHVAPHRTAARLGFCVNTRGLRRACILLRSRTQGMARPTTFVLTARGPFLGRLGAVWSGKHALLSSSFINC